MTLEETTKLLATIKSVYPSFGGEDIKQTVGVWHMILEDIPYENASAATMAYIRTEHFPPVPADIVERSGIAKRADRPTAVELWGIIRKAISNGIYGYVKEFEALPPICKRAVGRPQHLREWAVLGEELDTVVASNVQRTLERLLVLNDEIEALPPSAREVLLPEGNSLAYALGSAVALIGKGNDNGR